MNTAEKYELWLDVAQYDMQVAGNMFNGGHWLFVVFTCQQAIEKLARGLHLLYMGDDAPRLRDVAAIVRRFEHKLAQPVPYGKRCLFDELSSYSLNARCPAGSTGSGCGPEIARDEAELVLDGATELFEWMLDMKPQT
jgi:HEPN domain-containing protein